MSLAWESILWLVGHESSGQRAISSQTLTMSPVLGWCWLWAGPIRDAGTIKQVPGTEAPSSQSALFKGLFASTGTGLCQASQTLPLAPRGSWRVWTWPGAERVRRQPDHR